MPYTDPVKRRLMGRKYNAKWQNANREKYRKISREWWKAHRQQRYAECRAVVFGFYGHLCSCCGESIPQFLTIDHINGFKARQHEDAPRSGMQLYAWLEKKIKMGTPPTDYRTLCYNCNCGRARNGGLCPHKVQ